MAQFDYPRADARDLETVLTREWLVTNGLGGYASSTLAGINTRRYHGLLIAAMHPPVQRTALLVRLDAVVTIGDEIFDLMSAEYEDGTVFPRGYMRIESFSLDDGVPTWQYLAGSALLRQTLWMIPGRNITAVRYKLIAGAGPVELSLRPLTAARDHHAVQHGNAGWHFAVEAVPDGVRVQATPDAPSLWLLARGAEFLPGGDWYWKYQLRDERARGYDYIEDLYQPGTFRASLQPGGSLTFIASAEEPEDGLPEVDKALAGQRGSYAQRAVPVSRQEQKAGQVPVQIQQLVSSLVSAANAFLVQRAPATHGESATISLIAGYHWFTDWGRDAMISLSGLLLTTGRISQAAALLHTFAEQINHGMIPNRFPDTGEEAEYNAADATLWFFQALHHTLAAERREAAAQTLLTNLYPRLREIIDWHLRGTRYGIGVDRSDGLLHAGDPGSVDVRATQLTWMDARTEDTVHTPRIGKPVEINALWIAALDLMAVWAPRCHDDPAPYRLAAERARHSFAQRFWYESGGYLYDVVDGPDGDDPSLRPNQVIALALNAALLPEKQGKAALSVVEQRLLTPYGLRTLAPDDPRYRGQCVGVQSERDRAYHQGTVWPWLLDPYVEAHRRVYGESTLSFALLQPFVAHLREAGVGTVSEIFDGDAPHTPRGCIAQAWSVGALLRIATLLD